MGPKTYRKKPVEIQALEWTGKNVPEVMDFVDAGGFWGDGTFDIHTLEGVMSASPGDFIIRGVQGEFYPCKPDIFQATYEVVE